MEKEKIGIFFLSSPFLEAEEEWEKILFPRKFLPLFYYKRTGGRIGISKVSPIMEEKESEIWVRNFIPCDKVKISFEFKHESVKYSISFFIHLIHCLVITRNNA